MRGPQNEADCLILDWCNGHGLLGLVPVLSSSIRLPVSIEPGKYDFMRVITQRHHFRDGGIWHPSIMGSEISSSTAEEAEEYARQRAGARPQPHVTWFNWLLHFYEEKPSDHIRDFFLPSAFGLSSEIKKNIPVPCPNTPEFWQSYGEPLREFTTWCEMFAEAVKYLGQWEGGNQEPEPGTAAYAVRSAHWVLSGLAQSAAPSFSFNPEKNRLEEQRVSAGLLASYALMFLWDRMAGRLALRCQNCQQYFVSNEQRAKYCSPRCRNTAQSRRYRAGRG